MNIEKRNIVRENNEKVEKDSFVVVSDFHSTKWPLDKVENEYLNKYEKIFILGDITDRGPEHDGTGGIEMLKRVMLLEEKYPQRVVYVPGNHDKFLYDYAKNGSMSAARLIASNGGIETLNELNNLKKENPILAEKLINWLETRPIQVTHQKNGKNYYMAHAFFNENLYNYNKKLCLKDLNNLPRNLQDKVMQVLWFRKDQVYDDYSREDVVSDSVNGVVVIGHTPYRLRKNKNLNLINKYGQEIKVVCVDGGIYSDNNMHKYDGGVNAVRTEEHTNKKVKVNKYSIPDYIPQDTIMCEGTKRQFIDIENKCIYMNIKDKKEMKKKSTNASETQIMNYVLDQKEKLRKAMLELLKVNNYEIICEKMYDYITTGNPKELETYFKNSGIEPYFIPYVLNKNVTTHSNLSIYDVRAFVVGTAFDYAITCTYEKFNGDIEQTQKNIITYLLSEEGKYITQEVGQARDVIDGLYYGEAIGYVKYLNKKNNIKEYIRKVIDGNSNNKKYHK